MKINFIILISVIVIAIAGIFYLSISSDNVNTERKNESGSEELNNRPIYKDIIPVVFNDLPEYPSNLNIIKRDVYSGQVTDLDRLSENIYKQPEFYPTWEKNGIKWFTNHDYSRWGVHGSGFFPGELSYTIHNMSKNDSIDIYSFLHTSWGIETWQGLKLVPIFNSDYFEVSVTPDEVLLEPTFPKFYNNWSQKIKFKIKAIHSVPIGIYTFSIKFASPSNEMSNIWTWQVLDKYTENKYHDEIQKCINTINQSQIDKCSKLIELRQNKYISSGGTFAPSKQYTVIINVV